MGEMTDGQLRNALAVERGDVRSIRAAPTDWQTPLWLARRTVAVLKRECRKRGICTKRIGPRRPV